EAGDQVRCAGARGGAADADTAGGSRVAFGGEGGVLLVAHQDVADRMVVESVVERQGDAAGVTEDAVYVFTNQAFEQDLGAGHELGLGRAGRSMHGIGRHHSLQKVLLKLFKKSS